jgi:hypothetical protein
MAIPTLRDGVSKTISLQSAAAVSATGSLAINASQYLDTISMMAPS